MLTPQRPAPLALIERLRRAPRRFGLFPALRILQQAAECGMPGRVTVRNSVSLAFVAGEIESLSVEASSEGEPARWVLTPAGFGLLGLSGPLPYRDTELLSDEKAARAWLDLFVERLAWQAYRAWSQTRPALGPGRQDAGRAAPVLALAGLVSRGGAADAMAGEDRALAFHAGLLQRRTVSEAAIQQVLVHRVGVPVQVDSFAGAWYPLGPDGVTRLGRPGMALLGRGAVLGDRLWQRHLRIRVRIGPLDRAAFERFLPGGTAWPSLQRVVHRLVGASLEAEVRVALSLAEVPAARLGPGALRLGRDSLLGTAGARVAPPERVHVLGAVGGRA